LYDLSCIRQGQEVSGGSYRLSLSLLDGQIAPAAARQSSMERPSHCSLGSQVVTRDKKPMLLSGCGMCHPPSRLICEAFSSESCQHPASSIQHSALCGYSDPGSHFIPYPHHTLFFLRCGSNRPRLQTMLQRKLQAKPHPNAISCFPLPQCRHQDSRLMKPFPPTHRAIVTFPCGLKNSRMDMRGGPTISRVLSKLRTVTLVWKY
jgi:hypothetical protein